MQSAAPILIYSPWLSIMTLNFSLPLVSMIPVGTRTMIDQTGTEELAQTLQNTLCACKYYYVSNS